MYAFERCARSWPRKNTWPEVGSVRRKIARRERTPWRQARQVRRQSRNLIETSLLSQRVGHRTQKSARVRIAGSREKLGGRRLLKHFAGVHHDDVIGHAGDYAKVVRDQNN